MPTIRTGNQEWDQNLNTLGSALFPDPSKAAHAYYYGAEARKAQIEAAKIQDQMAAGHTALGMQFGRVPNPTYRTGDFATTMVDPYSQAPGPAPAPAAPPVPGTGSGLGAAITAMPPQAIANGVVAGIENNAQSGTLPPMAPPAATSPPAPTTTASNGTTPSNSPAMMHPASVTSAGGGGVMMAGPAAPDGTPAPSSFNMGQLIALQIAAGATPDAAYATARGTLGNMVKNGQIALPLAEQMAAFYGAPSMRNQALANEGALATGAQSQAGETARNTARIAGENFRAQLPTTFVPDPDPVKAARGEGRYLPLGQQQAAGGVPATNPAAVTAGGAYGDYFDPKNPSAPIVHTRAADADARGLTPVAKTSDANTAATIQRIMAIPDTAERMRALQDYTAAVSTPKELDPEKQAKQNSADYRSAQQIYSVPQKPVVSIGVKDPVAFDEATEVDINRRAYELSRIPENQRLRDDPTKLRAAAINDLMKNPTADGRRLPTPAEVNALRIPARTRIATLGTSGDERIDTRPSPTDKFGESSDHMMIRAMPPAEIAARVAAARGPAAKGAPAKGAPTPAPVPAPAPTVPVPFDDPTATSAPAISSTPGLVPTAGPAPAGPPPAGPPPAGPAPAPAAPAAAPQTFQEMLGRLFHGQLPPGRIFAPPSSVAAPVPTAAPVVSGGAPPGAIGPAAPGTPEGGRVYGPGGAVGVNRGGWTYPQ